MKAIHQLALTLFATALTAQVVAAAESTTPKVGDKAPPFEAKDQEGKIWKLTDALKESAVLLYFYPKDDTPGCTKEACGFRDRMDVIKKDGVQVLGVSFDTAESHQKFFAKHNLNFPLLVDADGKIADVYGARIAGRNLARRVSFLISKDGRIQRVTDVPSADIHLSEMQEAIAKLKEH
jgi:thioredoxin-dependent peroxiredoxin